ncbi:hypothetical protein ACFYY3_26250 [Streptomyces sp. NPDC001812]
MSPISRRYAGPTRAARARTPRPPYEDGPGVPAGGLGVLPRWTYAPATA